MLFRFLHPVLFLPRAMIKGPKSSFVVVIVLHLVGSVESWAKNVLNGTKNVRKQICSKSKNKCYERNKKCSQWKSWFQNDLIRLSTISNDLLWYWPYCNGLYGISSYCFYGLKLYFIAKYWFDSTWIVFSRGHRSKFIWSCLLCGLVIT